MSDRVAEGTVAPRVRWVARVLLAVFAVGVGALVFLPAEGHQTLALAGRMARWVSSWGVPYDWAFLVIEFGANIVLFVPVGVLVPVACGAVSRRALGWTVAAAALSSVVIETLQLWIPGRVSTPCDVLANTLGGLCGVLLVAFWVSRRARLSTAE